MNRLQEKYQTSVRAELANKFAYKSSMQIPRVEKIVINMGCGDAVANAKVLDDAVEEYNKDYNHEEQQITLNIGTKNHLKNEVASWMIVKIRTELEKIELQDIQGED